MLPKHPDTMSDDDLCAWVSHLVDDLVEEGPRLDYKEVQGLDSPKDRREVAKDISSFANEAGGVVLYGIPEKLTADGRPIPAKPYGIAPIPSFESRVEDILVDSIQPTLPEWKIRTIEVSRKPKKVVYVLWVPESWVGVHMVEGYGDARYYRRGQYRAVPMAEREVHQRYERILRTRNWVDEFVNSPEANYVAARLPEAYRSHYLVCPVIAFGNRVDFASPEVRKWVNSNPYPPWQYRPSPYGVRGRLVVRPENRWDPYTEIYKNGAISHWSPTVISQPANTLAYIDELRQLEKFLQYAGSLYSFIRYTGPIRVLFEISHMKPAAMSVLRFPHAGSDSNEWATLLTHDNVLRLELDESAMVLSSQPSLILKSLADEMFRAYGYWQADCFDENLRLRS